MLTGAGCARPGREGEFVTTDSIDAILGGTASDGIAEFGTGSLAGTDYKPFQFTAKRLILAALADRAISVVPVREAVPVLKHFQIQVAPGRLQLAATDLELSVLASTPAVTADATQTLVLPARKLLAILREAPDGDVTVEVAGDRAVVRAGTASWSLVLEDASSYPPLPDLDGAELHPVKRAAFLASLKAVRHAVGRDAGRLPLMQVNIIAGDDGNARVTACDGVRFARTVLPWSGTGMQLPAGALDDLVKMLDDTDLDEIQVGDAGPALAFQVGGTVFLATRPQAKFPDVDKLLLKPAEVNKLLLTADRGELSAAIRRVRINADESTSAIGLRISRDLLTVIARDTHGNRAEEAIAAGWAHGDRLAVVSHQFLSDMLAVYPSQQCRFWLGPETGRKHQVIALRDDTSGTIGIIYQMTAALVGYGD
jgi:DNA polymerase III subunit beta